MLDEQYSTATEVISKSMELLSSLNIWLLLLPGIVLSALFVLANYPEPPTNRLASHDN